MNSHKLIEIRIHLIHQIVFSKFKKI